MIKENPYQKANLTDILKLKNLLQNQPQNTKKISTIKNMEKLEKLKRSELKNKDELSLNRLLNSNYNVFSKLHGNKVKALKTEMSQQEQLLIRQLIRN